MAELDTSNQEKHAQERHSLIRAFHGDTPDRELCLGNDCPDKNCRICPAAGKGAGRRFYDHNGNHVGESQTVWDSYRDAAKGGYYTRTIQRTVDPDTGEEKYSYIRPG